MKKLVSLLLALTLILTAACAFADGSVYYLNFKPEADQAWQDLAATYTAQTGVKVKVVTAASGTYEQTLTAEMDKGAAAPTLFQCGTQAGVETWSDYLMPLDGTAILNEMTTSDFNLTKDGQTVTLGYCYEAYGIIVNKALLAKAGYTVADITNFASLKAVADDIHARAAELGFDAFTSSGLDGSSSWRFSGHLANQPLYYEFRDDGVTAQPATIKGTYLDNFKAIWDLYITDTATSPIEQLSATGDQAEAEFGTGKAVFYQNGTWEYANLTGTYGMNPDDLTMIPIYIGVDGEENDALPCGTENCWAINAKASEEDIKATIDFLVWVVTSEEGTTMMAEQFGPIPFKSAKASSNVFFNAANDLLAQGKTVVSWAFNWTPNVDTWRADVVAVMMAYTAGSGSWDDVAIIFTADWAIQYDAQ